MARPHCASTGGARSPRSTPATSARTRGDGPMHHGEPAIADRRAVRDAQRLSDRAVRTVRLVGGGARNPLPCQLTADACDLPVIAGPVEAAASGHALAQARAMGVQGEPVTFARRALGRRRASGVRALTRGPMPARHAHSAVVPAVGVGRCHADIRTNGTARRGGRGHAGANRRGTRWTAGLIVLAAMLAACGSRSNSGGSTTAPPPSPALRRRPALPQRPGSRSAPAHPPRRPRRRQAAGRRRARPTAPRRAARCRAGPPRGAPTATRRPGWRSPARRHVPVPVGRRGQVRPASTWSRSVRQADTGRPGLSLEGAVSGDPQ